MRGKTILYLLVTLWVIVFAASILMSLNIDGPRNLDTGLARLDTLVRGQLVALALAILAGAAGFLVSGGGWRQKLIGLAPLALTLVLVAGVVLFAMLRMGEVAAPADPVPPPRATVTEPAPANPTDY